MFKPGPHARTKIKSVNDELMKLEGTLTEEEAQITFAKFLAANPTFAASLILGVKLYPYQHIFYQTVKLKDFGLFICSRGLGKTFTSAVCVALYALFNPGVSIGIIALNWRQSKHIFKHIENFAKKPEGKFFAQCIGKVSKGTDAWELPIGQSRVYSIPLGDGGGIRGYRFNSIFIDEGLLLSETVVNEVIRPFLNVNFNPRNSQEFKAASNILLKEKRITQEEVDSLAYPSQKLMILSSATYTFEYLYKMMQDYESKIFSNPGETESKVSHAIFQLSYKMAPEGLLSESNIKEAQNTMSQAQFAREYESRFTDDSAAFFSPKKLREATVEAGQEPCTRIFGDPKKEYILAIDPNYADSETSDHFAMCILELNNEEKVATMVHGYAMAKSNITNRAFYVHYLLKHFNIVYIIVDKMGGDRFLKDIVEMPIFKDNKTELNFFEADFDNDDVLEGIKNSKKSYDKLSKKICHAQTFTLPWIELANNHLQNCLEKKRIMFASNMLSEARLKEQQGKSIPINDLYFDTFGDEEILESAAKQMSFIDHQAFIVELTKTECALIEATPRGNGGKNFGLPAKFASSKSPDKPRKDSYTVLLLANYAAKCYWDMMDNKTERNVFIPFTFS